MQLYLQCTCAVSCDLAYLCGSTFRGLAAVCSAHCPCTAVCLEHDTGKTNVSFIAIRILGSTVLLSLPGRLSQVSADMVCLTYATGLMPIKPFRFPFTHCGLCQITPHITLACSPYAACLWSSIPKPEVGQHLLFVKLLHRLSLSCHQSHSALGTLLHSQSS